MFKRFAPLGVLGPVVGGVLALLGTTAMADDVAAVKAAVAKALPDVKVDSVVASPIPGLYEVMVGSQIVYVTGDGRYFVDGRIVDLKTREDLTEPRLASVRKSTVNAVPDSDMVVFAPAKYEHTITVFTDIDCPYCAKMHSQISQYEDEGIRVRYLFYPRAGARSPSYDEAVSVWCADDRNQALTDAKAGKKIPAKTCDNPVDEHMAVARKVGINGTPAIMLETGDMIPGYVEPKRLAQMIARAGTK
jgi:thiol:disulfide interchange protein DsbC